MKKFTIPCSFGTYRAPFDVYIGDASPEWHPLYFQSLWLKHERGGRIPDEVMESFRKLADLAMKNNVSFEDLCVYALEAANEQKAADAAAARGEEEKGKTKEKADQTVSSAVYILGTPDVLHQVLDDDFYLFRVICKSNQNQYGHAIVLIRCENGPLLQRLVEEDKMRLEWLPDYGLVEYSSEGLDLDVNAIYPILAKYKVFP